MTSLFWWRHFQKSYLRYPNLNLFSFRLQISYIRKRNIRILIALWCWWLLWAIFRQVIFLWAFHLILNLTKNFSEPSFLYFRHSCTRILSISFLSLNYTLKKFSNINWNCSKLKNLKTSLGTELIRSFWQGSKHFTKSDILHNRAKTGHWLIMITGDADWDT